jgi:hypothetical protein
MEQNHTSLNVLFDQLGLPSEPREIEQFIKDNAVLPAETKIEDAEFWTTPQADFLKTALAEDGEWAEVIDQLSNLLR